MQHDSGHTAPRTTNSVPTGTCTARAALSDTDTDHLPWFTPTRHPAVASKSTTTCKISPFQPGLDPLPGACGLSLALTFTGIPKTAPPRPLWTSAGPVCCPNRLRARPRTAWQCQPQIPALGGTIPASAPDAAQLWLYCAAGHGTGIHGHIRIGARLYIHSECTGAPDRPDTVGRCGQPHAERGPRRALEGPGTALGAPPPARRTAGEAPASRGAPVRTPHSRCSAPAGTRCAHQPPRRGPCLPLGLWPLPGGRSDTVREARALSSPARAAAGVYSCPN
jgi:hypothetical protein